MSGTSEKRRFFFFFLEFLLIFKFAGTEAAACLGLAAGTLPPAIHVPAVAETQAVFSLPQDWGDLRGYDR